MGGGKRAWMETIVRAGSRYPASRSTPPIDETEPASVTSVDPWCVVVFHNKSIQFNSISATLRQFGAPRCDQSHGLRPLGAGGRRAAAARQRAAAGGAVEHRAVTHRGDRRRSRGRASGKRGVSSQACTSKEGEAGAGRAAPRRPGGEDRARVPHADAAHPLPLLRPAGPHPKVDQGVAGGGAEQGLAGRVPQGGRQDRHLHLADVVGPRVPRPRPRPERQVRQGRARLAERREEEPQVAHHRGGRRAADRREGARGLRRDAVDGLAVHLPGAPAPPPRRRRTTRRRSSRASRA